jgi:hypothetical protein
MAESLDRERKKYNQEAEQLHQILRRQPYAFLGSLAGIKQAELFDDKKDDLYLSEVKFTFHQPPPL